MADGASWAERAKARPRHERGDRSPDRRRRGRSSTAGSSPKSSRRRSPPTPSSARSRRRRCRARPTCCSITSWARPTASAACGPTSRAAWADSRKRSRKPAKDLGVEIRTEAEVAKILVHERCRHRRGAGQRRRVLKPRASRATSTATSPSTGCSTHADAAARLRGRDQPHRLRQRVAEDQRRARVTAELHRLPGTSRVRSIAAPCISSLTRTSSSAATTTPSTAGLRRTPSSRCICPRRSIPASRRRASICCRCSCSTRRTSSTDGAWDERAQGRVRRSLLRHHRAVRAGIQAVGHRPADPQPARSGGDLQPDRRQHLPGRDGAAPAVHVPSGPRLCGLPHADPRICTCAARQRTPGGGVMGASGWNAAREMLKR